MSDHELEPGLYFVPSLRDPAHPTTEEIAAGTRLDDDVWDTSVKTSSSHDSAAYTITINGRTNIDADDIDTALAAVQDMATGETLTIRRNR